jgi:flagellar biosynthetic protein FliO
MPDAGPVLISNQSMAVVAIVIAILAAVAYLLRRASPLRRSRQTMSVETVLSLGERRSLVIVAVEGRRLLLGMTPTNVGLVAELGAAFGASLDTSLGSARHTAPGVDAPP